MKRTIKLLVCLGLAWGVNAQAASVSYFLNQSDKLTDGIDYLKVTISDSTTTIGNIDFRVETTSNLAANSTGLFGILQFGFNPSSGINLTSSNISGLSGTWAFSQNTGIDGFGKFKVVEAGQSSNHQSLMTFSITGIANDTITSYANPSSGQHQAWVGAGSPYFASEVDGFIKTNGVTHAFFAGPSVVPAPVPAAAWLLGSGLIGLVGVARKKAA